MRNKIFQKLSLCFLLISVLSIQNITAQKLSDNQVKIEKADWFDSARNRQIPVVFYLPETEKLNKRRIVIFSHGYGQNKGGDHLAYSYLNENLAAKGFFVVSIQHEISTDDLMPTTGIPQIVRRPFWERGAENIFFVINNLKKNYPMLDFKNIALIGHSNGGDTSALFPLKYPNLVSKIITLDNRRMALPRTKFPKIYSLRSSDQKADEGVLPNENEQKKFGMTIINLPNTTHNQMDDSANDLQRKEINDYVLAFLNKRNK